MTMFCLSEKEPIPSLLRTPMTRTQDTEFELSPASFVDGHRPRLSDVLFGSRVRGFDSLAVTASNVRAVESAIRFASGVNPLVAIIGPSGWGKSHILEATALRWRTDLGHPTCPVISGLDWLADTRIRSFAGPLLLDNVQDLVAKTRSRLQLQLALERRVKAGKPTLLSFTETKLTRAIRNTLPSHRDWVIAVIKAPSPSERLQINSFMAQFEGLRMTDELNRILAYRLEGNGRTVHGALKRLKLTQSHWIDARATLKACGILNPYMTASSGWDLREHIFETAQALESELRKVTTPFDLALFVMLRVALLAECEVAKFFRVEPAKAFNYATRFESKVASSPTLERVVDQFVQRVISTL